MEDFGQLQIGKKFKFKSRTYTKVDEQTALSINNNKQFVKFFSSSQKVDIDISS